MNKKPVPHSAPARRPAAKASGGEARRKRIALAVATSGKSITAIAREENISRGHASALANAPQSRVEIARILDSYYDEAARLLEIALRVIGDALDAEKLVVTEHTETVNTPGKGRTTKRTRSVLSLGPDHLVRMTACKRLIELLTAGRPVPKPAPPAQEPGMITLEQLTLWAERLEAKKVLQEFTPEQAPILQ